jgi:hypothetical protein
MRCAMTKLLRARQDTAFFEDVRMFTMRPSRIV